MASLAIPEAAGDPLEILRRTFGFAAFRGQQEAVVAQVCAGGHALVVMPTGSGKSLCYQIPAIARPGTAIVVSPLIALMQDQVEGLTAAGVPASFINSNLDRAEQNERYLDFVRGRIALLYVAPERFANTRFLEVSSDPFLGWAITQGRPGTPMEAWQAKLGDAKIDDVVAYIRSFEKPATPEMLPAPTGKEPIVIHPKGQHPTFTLREEIYQFKAPYSRQHVRVLMGLDSADSHHTTNAMALDPGGATYLSDGVFHRTQVETEFGPVRNNDAAIYRYEPHTNRFETYVAYGFANPHGRVFDYWGTDIITDATGNNSYFGPAFSGYLDYPAKHANLKEFWKRPSRPCAGTGILSSRHFPEEFQGDFLNCNVIGFQGIFRVQVSEEGSGLKGETAEDLVKSDDPNFRPVAVDVAPDGSIYFLDWSNQLIGHMQHHIRDPNRDHRHGRIYRITYEGRPLLKPARIEGRPIAALLDLLGRIQSALAATEA